MLHQVREGFLGTCVEGLGGLLVCFGLVLVVGLVLAGLEFGCLLVGGLIDFGLGVLDLAGILVFCAGNLCGKHSGGQGGGKGERGIGAVHE